VRGNARFRTFVRSRVNDVRLGLPHQSLPSRLGRMGFEDPDDDYVMAPGQAPAEPAQAEAAAWRTTAVVAAVLVTVMVFGTRSLLGHTLPAIGQIPRTSGGLQGLWTSWWSGWQPAGLGVAAPASPALGLLALVGTFVIGAVGTLQHLVVLGPLLIGPLGAYRAARWWGSRRGRLASLVAYAVVPLPYNALSKGHWGGLLAYAAAPWILSSVGRLSGEVPYPATTAAQVRGRVVGIGLLVALVGAVAPSFMYVVALMGVALLAGSALSGRPEKGLRMAAVSVAAAFVAMVLLLPWSASVVGSRASLLGPSAGPQGRLGLGDVLRFHTGSFGNGLAGWSLLVVAALPLFVGRGWRLAWAARLWVVALTSFAVAWAGSRGWIPSVPVEVALSPAAAALAGSAALGAAAFEFDLPGYRFGWRQLAAAVAGFALAVASLMFVVASGGGRWHLPSADAASVLAFLPSPQSGDYRVMWVGYPDALPLAGRELHPGIAYGTSFDGPPGPDDLWISSNAGATPELASDLKLVENRLTTKVGHLMAPAGIRYLVLPNHDGPSGSGATAEPVPAVLLAGLALQTDLQVLDVGDPNFAVYQNSAWAPVRSVLADSASKVTAAEANGQRSVQRLDLAGSAPVLTGGNSASASGLVPSGSTIYVASTRSAGWRLDVGGRSIAPTPGFGWGMSFQVPAGGAGETAGGGGLVPAELTFHPSFWARSGRDLEILVWVVALTLLVDDLRRRRRTGADREVVNPDWFAPMDTPGGRRKGRRSGAAPGLVDDLDGDETWVDV